MIQPKSINKINGLIKRDQTIDFYRRLKDREHPAYQRSANWRTREFNRSQDNPIPFLPTNAIYFDCINNIYRAAGVYSPKGYSWNDSEIFDRKMYGDYIFESMTHDIILRYYINIDFSEGKGIYMVIDLTNFSRKIRDQVFMEKNYLIVPIRSNSSIQKFNADDFISRILRKYFHPPGFFRNIQILKHIDKKQAIQEYKNWLHERKTAVHEIDIEKAWRKLLKRDKNLLVDSSLIVKDWKNLYDKFERSKERKTIIRGPSVFEIMEAYDQEHDNEDSMESFYYNYIEDNYDPKKYILI